jgi:hypothetical protein
MSKEKPEKKSIFLPQEIEEWDLTLDMGILPKDISLTQNIGCVGGTSKKVIKSTSETKGKS